MAHYNLSSNMSDRINFDEMAERVIAEWEQSLDQETLDATPKDDAMALEVLGLDHAEEDFVDDREEAEARWLSVWHRHYAS